MTNTQGLVLFATGILLGSSVAATVMNIKYQKDLEREVDSVILSFSESPRVIFKEKKEDVSDVATATIKTGLAEQAVTNAKEDVTGFYYSPENEKIKKIFNIHGEELIINEDGVCEEEYEDVLPPLTEDDVFVYEEPRAISPSECEELVEDGYETCYWTLYQGSDGSKILTDDNDEPVDQTQRLATVGTAINMGEYEKDIAYVCNDRLRCVIEITEDLRNYADVMKAMPFINS